MSQRKGKENKNTQEESIKGMSGGWWRPFVLFSFIAALLILAKLFGLTGRLLELQDWIKGQGILGYVIFALIHIGAMIAAIPRTVLAVLAGVFFGSVVGIILVAVSAPIGAGVAFLIARYFARDAVAGLLSRSCKLKKLYQFIEQRGAIIVVVSRLFLILPCNFLNYAFGLTRIRFLTYFFWSFLCMLPATVFYVAGADTITKGISYMHIPWTLLSAVIISLIAIVIFANYAVIKLRNEKKNYKTEHSALQMFKSK